MARALYRKYRSKSFDEIVGQDHIVQTLTSAIASGRISHAYLLTGPRGVGKTSVARILAYEVNGLAYDEEATHLDIIEIDAASNRRIDEIRELRERVHVAPTSAKYKVYIIDEVHMLTREAFNALLKTLEEPPEHVIFILATTEAHKLPETIISRTQRFSFKPVELDAAVKHMATIAKLEKIDISKDALQLLAEHGNGSFRDSISLLDQLGSRGQKINAEDVQTALGIPPEAAVDELIDSVRTGKSKNILSVLQALKEQGVHPANLAKQLSHQLRQVLISDPSSIWTAPLLRRLLEVPASPDPQASLEISLLESAASLNVVSDETKPNNPPPPTTSDQPEIKEPEPSPKNEQPPEVAAEVKVAEYTSLDNWPAVLAAVKQAEPNLHTALRLSEPRVNGDHLELAFQFGLHQKKVNQAKNKQVLGKIIKDLTGKTLIISTVVDKNAKLSSDQSPETSDADGSQTEEPAHHATISSIFGGAEILEGER